MGRDKNFQLPHASTMAILEAQELGQDEPQSQWQERQPLSYILQEYGVLNKVEKQIEENLETWMKHDENSKRPHLVCMCEFI